MLLKGRLGDAAYYCDREPIVLALAVIDENSAVKSEKACSVKGSALIML
jgi:hypothetical protein